MFKSVFGRFQPRSQGCTTGITHNPSGQDEREEDGFLLIGETKSERSTITHQQFIAHQGIHPYNTQAGVALPPNYQTVTGKNIAGMTVAGLSPFGMDPVPSNNNHMLPIADIPFQLAPELTILQRLSMFTAEQGLQRTSLDWSKYDYDFNCELNYLKEHGIEHKQETIPERPQTDMIQF